MLLEHRNLPLQRLHLHLQLGKLPGCLSAPDQHVLWRATEASTCTGEAAKGG